MLNGKAEGSSALERALALIERTLALTQEVPSIKRALAEERAVRVAERAENDRRIAEIDKAMARLDRLPDDTLREPETPASPNGSVALAMLTTQLDLSGTDAIRLALLTLGDPGATAEPIVVAARKLEPSLTARNLYNALHRLMKGSELRGEGPRGTKHYSFTTEGKAKALATADRLRETAV